MKREGTDAISFGLKGSVDFEKKENPGEQR
jgi:hypothetical protein